MPLPSLEVIYGSPVSPVKESKLPSQHLKASTIRPYPTFTVSLSTNPLARQRELIPSPHHPLISSLCSSFCLCPGSPPDLLFHFHTTQILPICQSPARWPPPPESSLVFLPASVTFLPSSHSTTEHQLCGRMPGSPSSSLTTSCVTFSLTQCPHLQNGNNKCLLIVLL